MLGQIGRGPFVAVVVFCSLVAIAAGLLLSRAVSQKFGAAGVAVLLAGLAVLLASAIGALLRASA